MDAANSAKLQSAYGTRTLVPLDLALRLDRLPFKMSTNLMLDLTYWSVKLFSYEQVASYFWHRRHFSLSDDTIRQVKNFVGTLVVADVQAKIAQADPNWQPKSQGGTNLTYIYVTESPITLKGTQKCQSVTLAIFSSKDVSPLDGGFVVEKYDCLSIIGGAQDFAKALLWLIQQHEELFLGKSVIMFTPNTWLPDFAQKYLPKAKLTFDFDYFADLFVNLGKNLGLKDADLPEFVLPYLKLLQNNSWQSFQQTIKLKSHEAKEAISKAFWEKLLAFLEANAPFCPHQAVQASPDFLGHFVFADPHNFFEAKALALPKGAWQLETARAELLLRSKLTSNLWLSDVRDVVETYLDSAASTDLL